MSRSSRCGEQLSRDFFQHDTLAVAENLLGKILVFHAHHAVITETEAYIGQNDPACHAARGKTPRTAVMFGEAGYSYIYLIYGMYFCLNIVTEAEGFPAAVLIRGARLLSSSPPVLLNGPGKLCRALGLSREHNNQDLTISPHFCIENAPEKPSFQRTPRIGISKGQDKLWRFLAN